MTVGGDSGVVTVCNSDSTAVIKLTVVRHSSTTVTADDSKRRPTGVKMGLEHYIYTTLVFDTAFGVWL